MTRKRWAEPVMGNMARMRACSARHKMKVHAMNSNFRHLPQRIALMCEFVLKAHWNV